MNRPPSSQMMIANGIRIAVSLANAANENQMSTGEDAGASMSLFRKYASKPQKINPAAGKSTCASELWAKKTG